MKIYLIEAYDTNIKFDKNSVIIALTPEASYQLDKTRIKYSIIEDYYDEFELAKSEDKYFESQIEWIKRLDIFLQNNVPELKEFDLKMGTIYYLRLKTIIDALVIRCFTLNKAIDKIKPSNVTFISHPPEDLSLNCKLFNESNKSYYSQIIPILCNERNISLDIVHVDESEKISIEENNNLKQKTREVLAKSKLVNDAYFFFKYGKKWFTSNKKDKLNILLLKIGYNGMEIVKTSLKNGHNIYLLSSNQIMKYSLFGPRKHRDIDIKEKSTDNSKWENKANQLENDKLIKWINEKCQLDVSDIILPRLKYFVLNVCPEIVKYFKFFIEFYKEEKIDFVVIPNQTVPIEIGAISASKHCNGIKSVCVAHGDEMWERKSWKIFELYPYDIQISSNSEMKHYAEIQRKANQSCYSSVHRFLNIKKIKNKRNNQTIVKNRIIYLPTMFMWDKRRLIVNYPETWYYKLQKSFIEYFSTKNEYNFVWKGLPSAESIYNPIPDFIRDKHYSNIEISTNRFIEHLTSADRVICDYPSTGFYESVFAGIPTISLYHKALNIRKTAIEYFGKLLKSYSDISEALEGIEEFLQSSPKIYTAAIDTEDKSIIEILEEIGRVNTIDC